MVYLKCNWVSYTLSGIPPRHPCLTNHSRTLWLKLSSTNYCPQPTGHCLGSAGCRLAVGWSWVASPPHTTHPAATQLRLRLLASCGGEHCKAAEGPAPGGAHQHFHQSQGRPNSRVGAVGPHPHGRGSTGPNTDKCGIRTFLQSSYLGSLGTT